jgi:DNA/RNA endonuclease YhcR with UshA esterase domain
LEPRSLPYLWVGKTCFALSNASGVTTADDVGVDGTGTVDVSAAASTAALGGVPWGPAGEGHPPVMGGSVVRVGFNVRPP